MSANRFVVALHEEGWKIGYRGLWSGGYPDMEIALGVAVRMASASPGHDRAQLHVSTGATVAKVNPHCS
jgi:hypothetical protein